MNYRMIVRLLAITLRIVAVLMSPALVIALCCGEKSAAIAFVLTIGLMLLLSLATNVFKPRKTALYAREGFVITALAWIMLSVLGGLPYFVSGSIPSFVDCLFETVSGFTTTGASILRDVESLPYSILYWRSFTNWIGGMGVLVFLLAVSSFAGGKGDSMFIMKAESPGPQVSKLVPRTMKSARIVYVIYFAMTVIEIIFLLAGGMPLFDAVTLSFGTAGTGGFAVKNSNITSYTPYMQWVITVFMALFGVNFSLYYLMLLRSFKRVFKDEEMRLYFFVILLAIVIITVNIWPMFPQKPGDAIRHAAFQVVSIITTTGFATYDFNYWPQICHVVLMILMIIGACAGSTGGGVKCSRIIMLFRSLRVEAERMLHPNMVRPVKMDGKSIPDETVRNVYCYFGIYCIIAILSTLLLSLDGFSFETTFSAMLTCLNNIGPGLDAVGPMNNFADLSVGSKLLLSLDMLIGRLEIFPILLLFAPGVWTRAPKQKSHSL